MTFKKSLLLEAPTLYPSESEFADPITYLSSEKLSKLGREYGIVKIKPPQGWSPPFSINKSTFKFHTRLQKLSDLGIQTRSRLFFKENINRFIKMKKKKKISSYFKVENVQIYYYDLFVKVEHYGGYSSMTKQDWQATNAQFGVSTSTSALKDEYNSRIRDYAKYLNSKKTFDSFDYGENNDEESDDNCVVCGCNDNPDSTLLCDNCDDACHIQCLTPPLDYIPAGDWYCDKCLIGTGEYGFEEPETKYTLEEFQSMCEDFNKEFYAKYFNNREPSIDKLEEIFWKFIETENGLEVKYGADIHNPTPGEITGFPSKYSLNCSTSDKFKDYATHNFNLTNLPHAPSSLLNHIHTPISGMTVPWLYIGSLLSTFCWHVEDHYTYSANYSHFGSVKKWYGIPSSYAYEFEQVMRQTAPDLFQKQPDLLHQLVTLLSPSYLAEKGVKCSYADQHAGEFIITFPKVYHAGFNCGFNFNEAVNFASSDWVEMGERAVAEYKLIRKENVFGHYSLVWDVLGEFLNKATSQDFDHFNKIRKAGLKNAIDLKNILNSSECGLGIESGSYSGCNSTSKLQEKNYLNFIGTCLKMFKNYINQQSYFLKNSVFINVDKILVSKPGGFSDMIGEDDSSNESELCCDLCGTYLEHFYIVVNTKGSYVPVEIKQEDEMTERPFKNKISQLLTPDTSPLNQDVSDFMRPTRPLDSAMKISSIINKEEDMKQDHSFFATVLLESSQNQNLPSSTPPSDSETSSQGSIKSQAEEPPKQSQQSERDHRPLKRSARLQEKATSKQQKLSSAQELKHKKVETQLKGGQSKMGLVKNRSQLRALSQKVQIKLCLNDCITMFGKTGIPRGSKIMCDTELESLVGFVTLVESRLKRCFQDS